MVVRHDFVNTPRCIVAQHAVQQRFRLIKHRGRRRRRNPAADAFPPFQQFARFGDDCFFRRILRSLAHHQAMLPVRQFPAEGPQSVPCRFIPDPRRYADVPVKRHQDHIHAAQRDVPRKERAFLFMRLALHLHGNAHALAQRRCRECFVLLSKRQEAVLLLSDLDECRIHALHHARHAPEDDRIRCALAVVQEVFAQPAVFKDGDLLLFAGCNLNPAHHSVSSGTRSPFSSRASSRVRVIIVRGTSQPANELSALRSMSGLQDSRSVSPSVASRRSPSADSS